MLELSTKCSGVITVFINRLFGRKSDCSARVDHQPGDQTAASHSLERRDRRITYLKRILKNERRRRARELASKDSTIATLRQLIAEQSSSVDTSGRDAPTLEKELTMLTALLDEFEADALRARSSENRIGELEAEARSRETVITTLEQDINAWRCAASSAA